MGAARWLVTLARLELGTWQRYGIAMLLTPLAVVAIAPSSQWQLLSMMPIVICALIGGWGPALAASAAELIAHYLLGIAVPAYERPVWALCALALVGAANGIILAAALGNGVRRQAPAHHATLEEHFSTVFNCAPVAIMIVRLSDGQLVAVNSAFTELWGYTNADVLGRTSTQLGLWVEPEQLIQQLKANRNSDSQELQIRTISGAVREVLVSVRLIQFRDTAHLLVTAADVTDRKRAQELEHIANHDALTGLPNRMLLQSRLQRSPVRGTANRTLTALLFIDLDGFKAINDVLGHDAGDELLQVAALRMKSRVRGCDILARVGGDEFVVLLENLHAEHEAGSVAAELLLQMAQPFTLSLNREVRISASIGISFLNAYTAEAVATAYKQADVALYAAKRAGRNKIEVFHPGLPSAEPKLPSPQCSSEDLRGGCGTVPMRCRAGSKDSEAAHGRLEEGAADTLRSQSKS